MIPLHDEDRDPLQVWKRSLQEEDKPPTIEEERQGKMITKVIAYAFGFIFSATAWVYAGRFWIVVKQWLGL